MDIAQGLDLERHRGAVARRGRLLQYATIGWNSAEFVVAVVAGVLSGSVALVGFGVDSAIEVTSSVAALWRLGRDADHDARERAERRALQAIGVCFLLLAAYVAGDAALSLARREAPEVSVAGLVLAAGEHRLPEDAAFEVPDVAAALADEMVVMAGERLAELEPLRAA